MIDPPSLGIAAIRYRRRRCCQVVYATRAGRYSRLHNANCTNRPRTALEQRIAIHPLADGTIHMIPIRAAETEQE